MHDRDGRKSAFRQFGVQVARTTSNVELMSTIQECWLESVAADPGLDQFGEITRVIAPEPAASSRIAAGKRVLFLFRCVEGMTSHPKSFTRIVCSWALDYLVGNRSAQNTHGMNQK
jgi:hypothetical protein